MRISANKISNNYKRGQTLFLQGNPGTGVFCIRSGKVKLSRIAHDGKEVIVRIAAAGDVVGHQNLYSDETNTTTATVIEEAQICFIEKSFLLKMIQEHPVIGSNLIKKLSREIEQVETRNAVMSYKNVRERVAELLLSLGQSYGVTELNRTRLDIRLTREEMASMVGTANETVIRFITEFKEDGLIDQEGKTLYILDRKKLLQTANIPA